MSRPARTVLLATAIMGALALGGCGTADSTAKNDYVNQVNAAQTQFAGAAAKVKQQITKTSSAQRDRRALDRFVGTIERLVGTLRAIKVPAEVHADHGRLIAALATHGEELSQIIATMRSPTTAELSDVDRRLTASTVSVNAKLSAATDAINAKLRG